MSLLFLFQGMAANMEVCEQIEEISHFIEHYQDHKEGDGYSFFEYVYEDYIIDDGKSDDHHQDSDTKICLYIQAINVVNILFSLHLFNQH